MPSPPRAAAAFIKKCVWIEKKSSTGYKQAKTVKKNFFKFLKVQFTYM